MKKSFQLLSILILFFGAVIFMPFEKASELLQANMFSTEAEYVVAPKVVTEQSLQTSTVKTLETSGLFENGSTDFYLVHQKKGTERYVVEANTCPNGVRIIVRGNIEKRGTSADLHVYGLSRKTSRETYSNVLTLNETNPVKVLHLPSELIYDNDTLFPEYQITPSRNGDVLVYDVMCY